MRPHSRVLHRVLLKRVTETAVRHQVPTGGKLLEGRVRPHRNVPVMKSWQSQRAGGGELPRQCFRNLPNPAPGRGTKNAGNDRNAFRSAMEQARVASGVCS